MNTNLVISGGPLHDFDATTAAIVDLLAEAGVRSTVVDDPRARGTGGDVAIEFDALRFVDAGDPAIHHSFSCLVAIHDAFLPLIRKKMSLSWRMARNTRVLTAPGSHCTMAAISS